MHSPLSSAIVDILSKYYAQTGQDEKARRLLAGAAAPRTAPSFTALGDLMRSSSSDIVPTGEGEGLCVAHLDCSLMQSSSELSM